MRYGRFVLSSVTYSRTELSTDHATDEACSMRSGPSDPVRRTLTYSLYSRNQVTSTASASWGPASLRSYAQTATAGCPSHSAWGASEMSSRDPGAAARLER